ncbi:MAG: hypothetical protein J6C40_08950 [Lentisphaeria bacterium]|nr:hypothetical protein [Lentisphaeria bacterium]
MNTAINNTCAFFYATRPADRLRDQVTSQGASERYRLTPKGAELLNKVTEVQNDK